MMSCKGGMKETVLHIVCGLPATGKTTFGRTLAQRERAAFLDSDATTDLIIQAAHEAAGIDPHDRDSERYKRTYREPVYETLFNLAEENLTHVNVVIAGPFTSELREKEAWQKSLQKRFSPHEVILHHLEIPEEERMRRMKERGALRDTAKLEGIKKHH